MPSDSIRELFDKSTAVKWWAPWSGSLWLVRTEPGFWNKDCCLLRGYHEFKDVSKAVGRNSSMSLDVYYCAGCHAFFDEAFIHSASDGENDPLLGKCLDGLDYRRV